MADLKVKYQPPVVEFFDIRLDCVTFLLLLKTLEVAERELDVHEDVSQLITALTECYATSRDADPQVDGQAAAA